MRWCFLPAMLLACFSIFASEIVTKSSAPFNFPLQVSAVRWNQALAKGGFFNSRFFGAGNRGIELSWALPGSPRSGSIAIFNLSGVCVKSFPVSTAAGSVIWNGTGAGRAAKGIYIAKFSCGAFKKNLKLIIF